MKRVLIAIVLIAFVSIAVDQIGDLTQSRPDPVRKGEVTELVVSVHEDRFGLGQDGAADALWAVCSAHTTSRPLTGDGFAPAGDDLYRVVLTPALGRHAELKLVGCLGTSRSTACSRTSSRRNRSRSPASRSRLRSTGLWPWHLAVAVIGTFWSNDLKRVLRTL
jgi:hypothetical protein